MNKQQINELLEKYFEGETSISEERTLKSYFNTDAVDEDHELYKSLFSYYSIAQTDKLETDLNLTRIVAQKQSALRIMRFKIMSIAAVFIILIASVFFFNNQLDEVSSPELVQNEIEDPEDALEATLEALAYLGIQFNKGTDAMEEMKKLSKTQIMNN